MRIGRAVRLYREARRADLAPLTRRNHTYVLEGFAGHLGTDMALRAVRASHVQGWLASLAVAPSTAALRLGIVRGFLGWCLTEGMVAVNAAATVRAPSRPRALPRELVGDEPRRVLSACPDARARAVVSLMLHEGLRRAEVAHLTIGQIDQAAGVLEVVGKGGHTRIVPLSPESREAIDAYLAQHPLSSGPLVRSYHTGRALTPDTIGLLVAGVMRDAGVKQRAWDGRSAHANRHTAAGRMLDQGADPRVVQAFLGHESLGTTWVYTRRRAQVALIRDYQPRYEEEEP